MALIVVDNKTIVFQLTGVFALIKFASLSWLISVLDVDYLLLIGPQMTGGVGRIIP